MTTSTPAIASSPANIRPVGPPPATTTACAVTATPRPAVTPRVPPSVRRSHATRRSTTTHARRDSHVRRFWLRAGDSAARPGSCRKPPGALYRESGGRGCSPSLHVPPRNARTANEDAPDRLPAGVGRGQVAAAGEGEGAHPGSGRDGGPTSPHAVDARGAGLQLRRAERDCTPARPVRGSPPAGCRPRLLRTGGHHLRRGRRVPGGPQTPPHQWWNYHDAYGPGG